MKFCQVKYILLLYTALFLWGCANQLPPGGGDIDRIPPEIISLYPADGTINYNEEYFELEFSEYVDKRSFKDAVFISPSIEGNLEFDWSGRTIRVNFPGKLKDSLTYVISIGSDVVDLNNRNRMAQSFTFSFATGDKIDKRQISGRVYTDKPSGILIYAYNLGMSTPDPLKNKPDFISQAGTDGRFRLAGLAAGKYRIFAVKDEFRDFLFQPEQDRIGIPSVDVTLTPDDTLYSGLDFFMSDIDTAAPRILSAVMTDKNHILASFSEPIDSTYITKENFFIYDSTSNKRSNFIYAFKGNTKANEAVLVTVDEQKEGNNIFLIADTLIDKTGNIYINDNVGLTQSARVDTSKPELYKIIPPSNSSDIDFLSPVFFFSLNDALNVKDISKYIVFADTNGNKVPFKVTLIDDASFEISTGKLDAQKDYRIKLDIRNLSDAAGNKNDTIYTYKFRTISGLDFTGISGKLMYAPANAFIVLQGMDNKNIYKRSTNGGKFQVERVVPGKYLLWSFVDDDSNKIVSPGSLEPFRYSEKFSYYPDTLILRARWTQADLQFLFGQY